MQQKLAEPKPKPEHVIKTDTQTYKIQQIWKGLDKTAWNKETDEIKKRNLKGELYDKLSQIYEEDVGTKIKRHVIRRCVNSLINKAK